MLIGIDTTVLMTLIATVYNLVVQLEGACAMSCHSVKHSTIHRITDLEIQLSIATSGQWQPPDKLTLYPVKFETLFDA